MIRYHSLLILKTRVALFLSVLWQVTEEATGGILQKNVYLKISEISQKTPVLGRLF